MSQYTVKTAREFGGRPDVDRQINNEGWHDFMTQDTVANRLFHRLYDDFPDFQFVLYDGDQAVAGCNSIPVVWNLEERSLPETGWDWALESGVALLEQGAKPTTLCAIGITLARDAVGKGVSQHALRAMKAIAVEQGLNALIAPVRPTLKHRYPLTAMERYIHWTREDGTPFDPWLRTHWRAGATLIKVAPRSMVIPGTVAQWEQWTDMKFPESGDYIVPAALNPVIADVEHNLITYVEPNVWMHHPIE